MAWRGEARLRIARLGSARLGEACHCVARHGMGRTATFSASAWVRWGMPVGITGRGVARYGQARRGGAGKGKAWNGGLGK